MKILALERELPGAAEDVFQRYAQAKALAAWELTRRG